jgi:hypothetical protein
LGYNSPTERNVRRLLIKAGKALDTGNGQRALLAAENEQLRADLEALKPRTRKKVKEPANGGFSQSGRHRGSGEGFKKAPEVSEAEAGGGTGSGRRGSRGGSHSCNCEV